MAPNVLRPIPAIESLNQGAMSLPHFNVTTDAMPQPHFIHIYVELLFGCDNLK